MQFLRLPMLASSGLAVIASSLLYFKQKYVATHQLTGHWHWLGCCRQWNHISSNGPHRCPHKCSKATIFRHIRLWRPTHPDSWRRIAECHVYPSVKQGHRAWRYDLDVSWKCRQYRPSNTHCESLNKGAELQCVYAWISRIRAVYGNAWWERIEYRFSNSSRLHSKSIRDERHKDCSLRTESRWCGRHQPRG